MRKILLLIFILSSVMVFAQPQLPANLTGEIKLKQKFQIIRLSWQSSESAIGYNIYKKELNRSSKYHRILFPSLKNYFEDRFVFPGRTYSYYLTSFNKNGESSPSDTIEVTLPESVSNAFIEGYLYDDDSNTPLSNGQVFLFPVTGWNNYRIKVDSLGYFKKNIVAGKYLISFSSPGYIPEFYDDVKNILDASTVTIAENETLKVNAALYPFRKSERFSLNGKVTNSSGDPLKAAISVLSLNHSFFKRDLHFTVTDSAGNYKVTIRESDSVVVYAMPFDKEYLPEFYNNENEYAEADRIMVSNDIDSINFTLNKKPAFDNSISGQIKNTEDEGIPGSITLFKLRENKHAKYKRSVLSDSSGNFVFSNITPGKYILLCIPAEGYLPTFFKYSSTNTIRWKEADSVEVTENSKIDGINFAINTIPDSGLASINGKIEDNSGNAVDGAVVSAVNEYFEVSSYDISDENGYYKIPNLLPGIYTINADKYYYSGTGKENIVVDYQENITNNVDINLSPLVTTSPKNEKQKITGYKLDQNYPNPFNPETNITYQIPTAGFVSLKVYNIIGQEITTLVQESILPGIYNVKFDGSNLNSGIYFYKLQTATTVITRKMILLK